MEWVGKPVNGVGRRLAARVGIVALLWPIAPAWTQGVGTPPPAPAPAAQNPSPMLESTRSHGRLAPRPLGGTARSFSGPGAKPVDLWVPERVGSRDARSDVLSMLDDLRLSRADFVVLKFGTH